MTTGLSYQFEKQIAFRIFTIYIGTLSILLTLWFLFIILLTGFFINFSSFSRCKSVAFFIKTGFFSSSESLVILLLILQKNTGGVLNLIP